jgi:ATP-binding cassette subfamily B protein
MKKTKMKKGTGRKVLRLVRPYIGLLSLSLLMAVGSVLLSLYVPLRIGDAIDRMVGVGNVDFAAIMPILGEILLLVAFTALFQWLMNLINNKITYYIVSDLRVRTFANLQELPLKYIDGHPHGEILSRMVADVDQFSDGLLMGFSQLFTSGVTILGTLAFMVAVNVKIALAVVLVTPISLFVAGYIARHTYDMFHKQSEIRGEMTSLVEEYVGNQKVVQAFGYEEQAEERFGRINRNLRRCGQKAVFYSSMTNPCTRFVNSLVYGAVGVLGAFLCIGGSLSVGQLSCFLTYANQYTKPFNEISGVITELQNALACASRVFELMEEPQQEPDAPDAVCLTEVDGSVSIDDVSFSYRPEVPLIQHLNLQVKPGQRIAIVGPTGCGKTTLINLLMRFYDVDAGQIRVSQTPIRQMTRNSLRSSYGMVLQDTWLKAGTIRENIAGRKLRRKRSKRRQRRRTRTVLSGVCRRGMTP